MPSSPNHVLEFPGGYTRSVGPVIGRFLSDLRDGRLVGVRTRTGKVIFPPTDVGQAADPAWLYVIVSLRDEAPVLRAYRIRDGAIAEVAVALQPG